MPFLCRFLISSASANVNAELLRAVFSCGVMSCRFWRRLSFLFPLMWSISSPASGIPWVAIQITRETGNSLLSPTVKYPRLVLFSFRLCFVLFRLSRCILCQVMVSRYCGRFFSGFRHRFFCSSAVCSFAPPDDCKDCPCCSCDEVFVTVRGVGDFADDVCDSVHSG